MDYVCVGATYTYGTECALSCSYNLPLVGCDLIVCERDDNNSSDLSVGDGDQRVFNDRAATPDVAHDHPANLGFLVGIEDGVSRAAHIGQIDIVGAGATDEHQCREH